MMAKRSLPTQIKEADKAASNYIRQKYADENGNIKCITCGKVIPWRESHCAHYIERGKKATRWVEENLHPACPGCNVFHKEFHKREYSLVMIDLYGRDGVEWLKKEGARVLSPSEVRNLAEEAEEYYKQALKELLC